MTVNLLTKNLFYICSVFLTFHLYFSPIFKYFMQHSTATRNKIFLLFLVVIAFHCNMHITIDFKYCIFFRQSILLILLFSVIFFLLLFRWSNIITHSNLFQTFYSFFFFRCVVVDVSMVNLTVKWIVWPVITILTR